MNQRSDEELFSMLESEDNKERNKALDEVYKQHFSIISAFIKKNNGSEEEAADIFQDAIVVFYEKVRLKQLELSCSIRTYLYSICRNLWLNRLRSQKKMADIEDEIDAIPIPADSLEVLTSSERSKLLFRLIEKLGEDCKKVLVFYYFDRLRMAEIALQMNLMNEQVAKNKKSGCMKQLRAIVMDSPSIINMLK